MHQIRCFPVGGSHSHWEAPTKLANWDLHIYLAPTSISRVLHLRPSALSDNGEESFGAVMKPPKIFDESVTSLHRR
ncbi:hypothetical protein LTR95_005194 [Oleoguttula sp. CCFEE 5521]